jgi:hypothetical protein
MKRVVYTCLFGHSELFNDFIYERDGIDFICFTDDPELRSDFWKIELLPRKLLDPARAAKKIKALPHLYLAQYDWSLYVDNTVRLKAAPGRLFEQFLAPSKSALACFAHHERDCVYDEAKAVLSLRLDAAARVNAQMSLYRYLGYPAKLGLAKGAFLLRKHGDPALQRVMNTWYEQIFCHSKRDQLSLLPSCWIENFQLEYLPDGFASSDILDWPVLKDNLRLPRDFDEAVYLELNPDLANAGIDLRKHYLLSGQREHRKYRRFDLADVAASPLAAIRRIKRQLLLREN